MPKAAEAASTGARRSRRQRGSISAEEIVSGAFEVARGMSLDKLSMPTLAEYLDVGVTSIYWYFRKKDDLLNAMTDAAVDTYVKAMPECPPDRPWREALRAHYTAQRDLFRDDQTLADLVLIRTRTYSREATRRVLEQVENLVKMLIVQGFTPANALRVNNTISVYTRGIIIHDRLLRLSNASTLDARQSRVVDWATMPLLGSLAADYSFTGTREDDFEFGLDRLICGFERLLTEQDQSSR